MTPRLIHLGCHALLAAGISALGLHWAVTLGLWVILAAAGGDTLFRTIAKTTRR